VLAIAAAPATATTLLRLSFEDIVEQANVVAVGEAASSRVEQTEQGVVTVTTFEVTTPIVGEAPATFEIATPGGVVNRGAVAVREALPGAPTFLLGAEAMLFLSGDAEAYSLVGFSQGAYAVFDTPRGKSVRLPDADKVETVEEAAARIRAVKAQGDGRGLEDVQQ
jgi:hypothetical protein